ncbi:MAG TPA: helix-turn-helix domain-containing protein [Candidatus Binatia bacterium]
MGRIRESTMVIAEGTSLPRSVDDWLTKEQTAELLQISTRQVQRYIADGRLAASRLSHKVLRIRRQSVERLLNRSAL